MNKQEIERWIEQNRFIPSDSPSFQDLESIELGALRELLKTHAIVPREPTGKQLRAMSVLTFGEDKYKAMIKASEE